MPICRKQIFALRYLRNKSLYRNGHKMLTIDIYIYIHTSRLVEEISIWQTNYTWIYPSLGFSFEMRDGTEQSCVRDSPQSRIIVHTISYPPHATPRVNPVFDIIFFLAKSIVVSRTMDPGQFNLRNLPDPRERANRKRGVKTAFNSIEFQ